jgi:GH24 family phage-related lysozyme (muramidase)
MIAVSPRAIALIEGFEISAPYNPRAIWPGEGSGITVAVGYDLGYASPSDVIRDWHDLVSAGVLAAMQSCCGRKGASAQAMLHNVTFQIPYAAAECVFRERDIPRYSKITADAFPNVSELSGDSFGALVSLVFNRGASMVDPPKYPNTRLEMRQIRDACARRDFAAVPSLIRSMKRLWTNGLVDRREAEAVLFESGLNTSAKSPVSPLISTEMGPKTPGNDQISNLAMAAPESDADALDAEFNPPQGATT